MTKSDEFASLPVVGRLPRAQAVAKLRELGEVEAAGALEGEQAGVTRTLGKTRPWPFDDRPWQHTAHAFGYLSAPVPGKADTVIHHAGDIRADAGLVNTRIKVTLDCLRVAGYPGGGTHLVLCDFHAQNQVVKNIKESLHFNATYRVRDGERAAILGYPIFVGLNIGADGIEFRCLTVNVKNDQDEAFLGFLESDVFRAGLKLVASSQPAIAPLSEMALGLTKSIASRSRNVPVQDVFLGLDFSEDVPTRARLALGSYIAVQVPETRRAVWNWNDWIYDRTSGQIVRRANTAELIPYNYMVFGISHYDG
jgi:hypothetical protein